MKRFRIYALLLLTSCLSSCSWQEYFAIVNTSGSSVSVAYTIGPSGDGFPIFSTDFRAYKTTATNGINWDLPVNLTDTDTSKNTVLVSLPDDVILVIGELSNDHYSHYDQQFINDRVFNLQSVDVPINATGIIPKTFDRFFRMKNGIITYEIK